MRLAIPGRMTMTSPRDGSATDLLGGLITDAKDLVVAHGERMKLEVRDELGGLKDWIKLVGIAVAAVAVGLAAATGMPVWAGYAIVAVVAAVAGYIAFKRRPPTHEIDLVPERSIRDAKRDAKMVTSAVKS